MSHILRVSLLAGLVLGGPVFAGGGAPTSADSEPPRVSVSDSKTDADGFRVHTVTSEFQAGETVIRVLLPEGLKPGERVPVVYVLPVEARDESRYGVGLREVKTHALHTKYRAIFVAPSFSHLPWYADHPTDPEIRQESYLLQVVVPFVERTYPVKSERAGRLLLGFSKSGFGAVALLLRHPDLFAKAAVWDAPLMMEKPGAYGSGAIFGTQDNFDRYRPDRLFASTTEFGPTKRVFLSGSANFRDHHDRAHAQFDRLKIPHEFATDGPARKHDWHSGWVGPAVAWLLTPGDPR